MRREFSKTGTALNHHIDTIRTMERSQLELEMRNLQTVLSPHMIFNSLTAIRWMATFLQVEVISDMLTELAEMLRPVLREWRIHWTIREELEHLKHYTHLLDLRYGNHFKLVSDIPDELYEMLVPRFTIQPLVENACEHGGRPKKALVVTVRATREDSWIKMTVSNNGRSISPEEVEYVREILRSGNRGKNIGLHNVYTRLKTCMGKDSIVDVESLQEGGTKVTLQWKCIPK